MTVESNEDSDNKEIISLEQLKQMLTHLLWANMDKSLHYYKKIPHDIMSTFKPYKYADKAGKDVLQLPRGVLNLIVAIAKSALIAVNLVFAALFLLVGIPLIASIAGGGILGYKASGKGFFGVLVGIGVGVVAGLATGVLAFAAMCVLTVPLLAISAVIQAIEPVGQALYGALQVVSYPLVPFRMMLRGLLNLVVGAPKIEEGAKLQATVDSLGEGLKSDNDVNVENLRGTLHGGDHKFLWRMKNDEVDYFELTKSSAKKIHDKLDMRSNEKGQPTGINLAKEGDLYSKLSDKASVENIANYKALFNKPANDNNNGNNNTTSDDTTPQVVTVK